jgi:protein-disulfide isomerase
VGDGLRCVTWGGVIEWQHVDLVCKESALGLVGMSRIVFAALMVSVTGAGVGTVAGAQTAVPAGEVVSHFADTSMLKPPAGVKVAIVEWEDLECPYCAHAFPFVHAAIGHYKIPLVRYDFHIPGHVWSHEGAIYARYLEDKISPELATEYRREVFASQFKIANKDDLNRFTKDFFAKNGKELPFVVDPTGQLEREVSEGDVLGLRLSSRMYTPTIIVVTPKAWIEVKDVADLYQAIDEAEATVGGSSAAKQ